MLPASVERKWEVAQNIRLILPCLLDLWSGAYVLNYLHVIASRIQCQCCSALNLKTNECLCWAPTSFMEQDSPECQWGYITSRSGPSLAIWRSWGKRRRWPMRKERRQRLIVPLLLRAGRPSPPKFGASSWPNGPSGPGPLVDCTMMRRPSSFAINSISIKVHDVEA